MRRLLVLFMCLSISYTVWAQLHVEETVPAAESDYSTNDGYEYACQSDIYLSYVNSKIRKIDGYYYAWIKKKVVKDISKERERLAKLYENNKYLSYKYSVYLYIFDLQSFKTKILDATDYNDNDKVIDGASWDFYEADWQYALPGSILDCICTKVEDMVEK